MGLQIVSWPFSSWFYFDQIVVDVSSVVVPDSFDLTLELGQSGSLEKKVLIVGSLAVGRIAMENVAEIWRREVWLKRTVSFGGVW